MRIRVEDIPAEGRELEFDLSRAELNARVTTDDGAPKSAEADRLPYTFETDPHARVRLVPEGTTVMMTGTVRGEYSTVCARCAEETRKNLETELDLVLKPRSNQPGEDEDLHFGLYQGDEIDCAVFAEEFMLLSLPFAALCTDNCLGLCAHCGKNLNQGLCGCKVEEQGDPRLSVLRGLKLH